jgi:1-acyl-sn-glycerol-3-phosphate acyltransferase
MIYFFSWLASLMVVKICCGLKVVGRENVPKDGPFILASNHESNADPFLLGMSLPCSKWFSYLAKKELFEGNVRGWYFRKIHAIPLSRGEADPSAIKKVLKILKSGRPMVLFPEGTRSKGKGLQKGKPGVGFIVAKARVPVVPAYIDGSYKAMPESFGSINRSKIRVFIGKPVYFDWTIFDKHGKDAYQNVSDEIMRRIAGLKEEYVDKVS